MIIRVMLFILWLCVWLFLSWPPTPLYAIIGIPVSVFVVFMTMDFFADNPAQLRNPLRYLWFIYYILIFLWECLKANIDVAFRVIHPSLPIRPGTVKVKTDLKSDTGLTFLTSSITLTPGTTTVDVDTGEGVLYIHCLNIKGDCGEENTRIATVERLERILKRIFD